ncbi:MAG TPA: hypothetical protein VLV83_07315 [Acidobacteriota bacterium]|nr:hypothetical protein [Acidobacteriota bacterium]
MAAIVILLAALLSLLPVVAGSLNQYRQATQRWSQAVAAWSRAQRLRAGAVEGERFQPAPMGLPLRRLRLDGGSGDDPPALPESPPLGWEVLHGAR